MEKHEQILVCRKCRTDLTVPLLAITDGATMHALCTFIEGEAVVSQGRYLKLAEDTAITGGSQYFNMIPAGETWVHLDDLTDRVGMTHLSRRLIGCCGVSGCDGPNRTCLCGQHVGTQFSDCYELHGFQLDARATLWKNKK